MYLCVYVCIYIYIERERDRERERDPPRGVRGRAAPRARPERLRAGDGRQGEPLV